MNTIEEVIAKTEKYLSEFHEEGKEAWKREIVALIRYAYVLGKSIGIAEAGDMYSAMEEEKSKSTQ